MSTAEPPLWPHCAHGADPAADPVGCRGIHVPGHTVCLAHLSVDDRDSYLAALTPGAGIDHRGTHFTESLLNALLNALHDPETGHPRLGHTKFELATFEGDALFESVIFEDCALFESVIFAGDHALFGQATFKSSANFASATFKGQAGFDQATFEVGSAGFGSATFEAATLRAAPSSA
ncbi:pentapeptide repeat-containing protein [Streptomyces zhihengii]